MMLPNLFHAKQNLFLFSEVLNGNKPHTYVSSEELRDYAKSLGLSVVSTYHEMQCYHVSFKRPVSDYFDSSDVRGILPTASRLYEKIKNKTPAEAFAWLENYMHTTSTETFEISVLNGLLCGYPICDVVEYLENQFRPERNHLVTGRKTKYGKLARIDPTRYRVYCAYCRKEYVKKHDKKM